MKKTLALFLVVVLSIASVACFAETAAAPAAINWADFEAKAAEHHGSFVKLADSGLMINLPEGWVDNPVSEEDKAKGMFVILNTAKDKEDPLFTIVNAQTMAVTVADLKAKMEEMKAGSTKEETLNGTTVVSCTLEADGVKTMSIFFPEDEGAKTIAISFTPVTDKNLDLVNLMIASLQAAKE